MKGQPLPAEGALQTGNKLASEYAAEHLDRQEEGGSRRNPPGGICGQSAAWQDTVDVRMSLQCLAPRMKEAETADFCTEVFGIGRYLEYGRRAGFEQEFEKN